MVVVRKIRAKMRRIYSREPWNEEDRSVVGEFDNCKIERINTLKPREERRYLSIAILQAILISFLDAVRNL